jgi:hypothetical protein
VMAVAAATSLFGNGGAGQYAYFNAIDAAGDVRDEKARKDAYACGNRMMFDNDTVTTSYCWSLPLDPGLEMGLDFDLTTLGEYSIPIGSMTLQPGARLQGTLLRTPPPVPQDQRQQGQNNQQPSTVVAQFLQSARVDINPQGEHLFKGTIKATPESDFLAYQKGASLRLVLELRVAKPDNPALGPRTYPTLLPGGHFTLPLHEYEDPVGQIFASTSLIVMNLTGESHRVTNPGKTIVYNVSLHNSDNRTHELQLNVSGLNSEWARIVGPAKLSMDSHANATTRVAVTFPASAKNNDRADLIFEAYNPDVLEARALLRMVATATTMGDYADEAAFAAEPAKSKSTSALPLAFLLAALATAVLIVRRRP